MTTLSAVNARMMVVRSGRGGDNGWACPDGARRRNWDRGSAGPASSARGAGSGGRRGEQRHGRCGRVTSRAAGLGVVRVS